MNKARRECEEQPGAHQAYTERMLGLAVSGVTDEAASDLRALWAAAAARREGPGVASSKRCGPDDGEVDPLFVVHWTHVPKAGGTAFARIAKAASFRGAKG